MRQTGPSIFLGLEGIEYFKFEEDFMEANMRCIPMAVRFKLDAVRIKLTLSAWAKFSNEKKVSLALDPCETQTQQVKYANRLIQWIEKYTGQRAMVVPPEKLTSDWMLGTEVPLRFRIKAAEFGWEISLKAWNSLTDLQRYSLLKLTNPSHENKNFPIAMHEFQLV
ncbi:MAG: nitrate reductase associated protein [Bacteroidota bacterium]